MIEYFFHGLWILAVGVLSIAALRKAPARLRLAVAAAALAMTVIPWSWVAPPEARVHAANRNKRHDKQKIVFVRGFWGG